MIVSSAMRTEIKDRRPRDLNSLALLVFQPFLISVEKFPVICQKFPVPLCREFSQQAFEFSN